MDHPPSPPPSLIDRVESFVSEHKQGILIGTAAVAALAGVAYYASTSRTAAVESDPERGKKDKKKSKKRKGKDKDDGPILEEKPLNKAETEEGPYSPITSHHTQFSFQLVHICQMTMF